MPVKISKLIILYKYRVELTTLSAYREMFLLGIS